MSNDDYTDQPEQTPVLDEAVQDSVRALQSSIEEWAKITKDSLDKAIDGSYTANALVADVTKAWGRVLLDGSTALQLALKLGLAIPNVFTPTGDERP
jgi:hypothetical protein